MVEERSLVRTPLLLAGLLIVTLAGCERSEPTLAPYFENETHFRVIRESLYNRIIIEREGDEVTMRFRIGERSGQRQTAVDLSDPGRLVVPYTRTMLAAAWVQPNPEQILQIGLGGGGLNRFLTAVNSNLQLQTAELDPAVLETAEAYMGYQRSNRDQVTLMDGRMFLKRHPEQRYDWIFLDAYREGTVPVHLKTREFYQLVSDRLAPGGVVAANLHNTSALFESDVATLKSVFPEVHLYETTDRANVVALAFHGSPPDFQQEQPEFFTNRSELMETVRGEYAGPAKATEALLLTDDFAPAEYLQSQKTR